MTRINSSPVPSDYAQGHPIQRCSTMINVYSKPNCPQCEATRQHLDKLGIAYNDIDITVHRAELARLVAMGYRVAPVVETDHDAWSGYQPEKIRALVSMARHTRTSG